MIDYYYSIPELNTKDRIQECVNYYQKKNILKNINGIGGIKEITERILQVIC